MIRLTLGFLLLVAASAASAKVYKCTAADGSVSYQQTDCPKEQEQERTVVANTAPATLTEREKFNAEAYRLGMTPDQLRAALEHQRQERLGIVPETNVIQSQPTQQPRRRRSGGVGFRGTAGQDTSSSDNPCPPGQVPIGRSNYGDGSGFSASTGYTKARCISDTRQTDTQIVRQEVPQDQVLRDQHGNEYHQPAGSAFVRDKKTGQQCFKFGNFVKCD